MKVIIEEGIWDIRQKLPLRKSILTYDAKQITRKLFILAQHGRSDERNNKIDVIDLDKIQLKIDLNKVNKLSTNEIGKYLKKEAKHFEPISIFERNVANEIECFTLPIITNE
jgi:hypothetical protein